MTEPTPDIEKELETGAEPPKPRPRRKPSRLRKAYLWTRNKARESGGLLFLLALMAFGALGLYQFDTLQEDDQSCNQTCRFTYKDDRPKTLQEQEDFWSCRNICQTQGREKARDFVFALSKRDSEEKEESAASTGVTTDRGGTKNQQQRNQKPPEKPTGAPSGWSSIAAWFGRAWGAVETVAGNTWSFVSGRTMPEQLLALLTTLSLIAVLVGIGGAILLLILRFFRLSSLIRVVQGIQGDTLKLLLAGSALAATTAGAGFLAGKATEPPDLTELSRQASVLQTRLAEIDRQAGALLPELERARDKVSQDLSVTNADVVRKLAALESKLDLIEGRIGNPTGGTSISRDVERLRTEIGIFTKVISTNTPTTDKAALQGLEGRINVLDVSLDHQQELIDDLGKKLGSFADRDQALQTLLRDWNRELAANRAELQKVRKTLGSL